MSEPERFRAVEPMELDYLRCEVGRAVELDRADQYAHVGALALTVAEARELRDWLNAALPEEPNT